MSKVVAPHCAETFLDAWIMPYGIPNFLLTNNGPQYVAKFFASLCVSLGLKHMTTTAYHPKANGQAERYNRTLCASLRHFVSEHHDDWDNYMPSLTYSYNIQVHRSTGTTLFTLVHSRPPHPPALQPIIDDVRPAGQQSTKFIKTSFMARMQKLMPSADKRLNTAQGQYKRYQDRTVLVLPTVKAVQFLFVDRALGTATNESYKTRLPKAIGPYKVLDCTPETFIITEDGLRNTVSVAHVALTPYRRIIVREDAHATRNDAEISSLANNRTASSRTPSAETTAFVIYRIVVHEFHDEGRLHRLRSYRYTADDDTLEPAHHLPNTFVARYELRLNESSTAGTASLEKGRGTRKRFSAKYKK